MDWMKMSKLTKKSKGWGRVVTKMTKVKISNFNHRNSVK